MHMAHGKSVGASGDDSPDNCSTKCIRCHIGKEHAYGKSGVKPCPKKVLERAK